MNTQTISAPFRCVLRMMPGIRKWLKGLALISYDYCRFCRYSGSFDKRSQEAERAELIKAYHQIEKGLTMPRRRLDFGHKVILDVMDRVEKYEKKYGFTDSQCSHAAGCVRAYLELHRNVGFKITEDDFWKRVIAFDKVHQNCPVARQCHVTREEYFSDCDAPFKAFAYSRHTSRHYANEELPLDRLESAIDLAMTAPSACNRQHTRVHCIVSHQLRDEIYKLQNGNRGFGADADKLLMITADLRDICWDEERNDPYFNAGLFAMNLCYALHYYQIAHCVLNWSVPARHDKAMRKLINLPENEVAVALISCGNAPEEFDVCTSPKKDYHEILTIHG